MEDNNNIRQELLEIAPSLAELNKTLPYSLSSSYFDNLADEIWNKIYAEQKAQLPVGYFENLASNVMGRIKEEENELATIAPILANLPKTMPYQTPTGYFESLSENNLRNIKEDENELVAIAPNLASLPKAMPYQVPEGYFESLKPTLPATQGKVAKMNWMKSAKYAAAAVFVGVLAFGAVQLLNPTPSLDGAVAKGVEIAKKNTFDTELAKVSDTEIISYLENNSEDLDVASIVPLVDAENEIELKTQNNEDEVLNNYLNTLSEEDLMN